LRNGRDSFLVELGKYGLGKRDLAANINFFTRVEVDDAGNLKWGAEQSQAGDVVELRFEMDTIVVFHTCPHPLNPSIEYPRKPIRYEISQRPTVNADDLCRNQRPESTRAFENTALYQQRKRGNV
jgi:hypothetical protein